MKHSDDTFERHSIWLRISHWFNVPILFLMIWSGLQIYWANDVYPGFYPQWFYSFFSLNNKLAEGLATHFTIAWLFFLNGISYVLYLVLKKHWKEIIPSKKTTVFSLEQRIAYSGVFVMAIGILLSGIAIYKPVQMQWLTTLMGGYKSARLIHFAITQLFIFFTLVHIVQVIRAGWNTFRAMVDGIEYYTHE